MIMLFPIVRIQNYFTHLRVINVPVASDTYLGNPKWAQVDSEVKEILTDGSKHLILKPENEPKCLQVPQYLPCSLCSMSDMPPELNDPCLAPLITDMPPIQLNETACKMVAVGAPDDLTIQVDEDEWAYADPSPGTLTEVCTNNLSQRTSSTHNLGYSGILKLSRDCEYTVMDGPFRTISPYLRNVKLTSLPGHRYQPVIRQVIEDIGNIQLHFRTYGYVYVSVCAGILVLTWLLISYLIVRRCRRKRRRTRAYQTVRTNDTDIDDTTRVIEGVARLLTLPTAARGLARTLPLRNMRV
jgi:hypothetical protein